MRANYSKGFTLIEVLIASAIVVASMGLLLNLFGSGLDRLNRVSRTAHLILAEKEIVNRLRTINPAVSETGSGMAEGMRYRWESKLIVPFEHLSPDLGEILDSRLVGLYRIDIELIQENDRKSDLSIIRLGWINDK